MLYNITFFFFGGGGGGGGGGGVSDLSKLNFWLDFVLGYYH